MPEPLYTIDNCRPAYQLRWSLVLFAHSELPTQENWLPTLKTAGEADGVRILEAQNTSSTTWQFLLSTMPEVKPPEIVKSVKGRLQHFLQKSFPKAFHRNFAISSVGDASRSVIEDYVSEQLGHHRMADARVQELLTRYQINFPDVELGLMRRSSHGSYLYNLHLVLVHQARWREIRETDLDTTRDMILKTALKKEHLLSRAAILSDHIHLTLGCAIDESPQTVALSYLNNLSYAHGMQDRYYFGYYVGTFGEYDMNAIRY